MKICPKCRAANPDEALFCRSCGADLAAVSATPDRQEAASLPPREVSQVPGSGQRVAVSMPAQWIVPGVVGLMATILLLVLIIVGLAGRRSSEGILVVLGIVPNLIRLYAFLLALLGSYALVAKMDLSHFFSPVKGWMRFLVLLAIAELLYLPLAYVTDRVFTFVNRGTHVAVILESLAEGGLLILVLAGIYWLLSRQKR